MSLDTHAAASPATNVVLRPLPGMRRELEAVLERQDRTRRRVVRLDQHLEARFAAIRASIAELRSDAFLHESQVLTRHDEILRRLDAAEMPIELDVAE